jgi:hypothetical protein
VGDTVVTLCSSPLENGGMRQGFARWDAVPREDDIEYWEERIRWRSQRGNTLQCENRVGIGKR